MLYNTLHNRWLRLVACVVGELISAAALNIFIVPLNLYTGGLLGFCQVARTLMQTHLHISFGAYDVAGIFYFILNIPILLLAFLLMERTVPAFYTHVRSPAWLGACAALLLFCLRQLRFIFSRPDFPEMGCGR